MSSGRGDGGCSAAAVIADVLEARGYLAVLGSARDIIAALDAAGFAIVRKPVGVGAEANLEGRGAWPTATSHV